MLIARDSALVGVKDVNGVSIFKDKEATAFTNEEETIADTVKVRPLCPPIPAIY